MIIDTMIGERGLTERYPELGTGPVSTGPYYSETHYELEKQRLFRRAWLSIGRVEQVAEPDETLAEYLGDVGKRMHGFPFGKATVRYACRAELRCNWKVSLDAFCEGYHVMFSGRSRQTVRCGRVAPTMNRRTTRLNDSGRNTCTCCGARTG